MHKPTKSLPLFPLRIPHSTSPLPFPREPRTDTVPSFISSLRKSHRKDTSQQPLSIPAAKIVFYESYKRLPLITDRNRFKHIEDSASVAYLQAIDKQHLNPQPFGVVRARGKETSLDLQGQCIGDNYASALSNGLAHLQSIEYVNLTRNRLTEAGAKCILSKLVSQQLKELNLSNNKLGTASIKLLISIINKEKTELARLNLENVGAREESFSQLLGYVANNRSIVYLNLAKNGITSLAAVAIKEMLVKNNTIALLDLHWNRLNSNAGAVIFAGLAQNRGLAELDLSWNSIGNNSQDNCIESISAVLSTQKFLMHLDFSYNNFTIDESKTIARAMESNHSLFGLHMEGNNCTVDGNGFLHPQKIRQLQESGLLFRRMFSDRKIGDNCWVCEKWVEYTLKLNIPVLPPVYIHLECDNYKPYLLSGTKGNYDITRAFPPKLQNFFCSNGSRLVMVSEAQGCDLDESIKCQLENGEVFIVKKTNIFRPKGNGLSLKRPFATRPRMVSVFAPTMTEERILWSFDQSIFNDYIIDSKELINDCFEFDWSLSRLRNLIKDPIDQKKTKKYLKRMYPHIRMCYKSLSSFSGSEVYSIGTNIMTDFLYMCKIIDPLYLINDLGVNWNSTNVPMFKDQLFNPGNTLVRYEFLELLVRVAQDRFIRHKACPTFKKAVKKLISEHILPYTSDNRNNTINTMDSNWWRENVYFCEDVDHALKAYKPILETAYKRYSGKKTLPGCKRFMCMEEFGELCRDADLLSEDISNREAAFCFVQAMMTQVDEYYKKRHFEMSFVEFLEAVSRVCDMRDASGESLFRKLDKGLKNLIKVCPKAVGEAFAVPNEDTYHAMKYRTGKA